MGTSALSSEMAMGRRPIAKSGLYSVVPIEEVYYHTRIDVAQLGV